MKTELRILSLAVLIAGLNAARAQPTQVVSQPAAGLPGNGWQPCQQMTDDAARLACFDRWARQQTPPPVTATAAMSPTASPSNAAAAAPTAPVTEQATAATDEGCRDPQYSSLSRYWELESRTSCGLFNFRGYRPLNVSLGVATHPPATPTSPAPGRDGVAQSYQAQDLRLSLSVRTKIGQGLLTGSDPTRKDSLWFAYTQQSTWQVFNGALSRPFRTTDHEPELIYVYPTDFGLPGGWRLRYGGLGLNHQSNGQGLPLSRSWNRVYLMAGADLDDRYILSARVWKRLSEKRATFIDPGDDDNPDIAHYLGRAEVRGAWNLDRKNQLVATLRNNLQASGKGSIRLEWLTALGDPAHSNLRLHAQIFHGYGDSLLDYNVKRTVFMLGLSLMDF